MNAAEYNQRREELFGRWQKRELHKNVLPFNKDGIVNPEEWFKQDERVLFLLKEAYHTKPYDTFDLSQKLRDYGPWDVMWPRVAEWSYGIRNTTKERIADFTEIYNDKDKQKRKAEIQRIAVVNIKKSGGQKSSSETDLQHYADADADLLTEQIDLINPTVIICGYTFGHLNSFYCGNAINKKGNYNPNCFYIYKGITILDYYHPAAEGMPAFMAYYALCAIWQKALKTAQTLNKD